jgi:translation elongation factor EF-Tu-like GTPase
VTPLAKVEDSFAITGRGCVIVFKFLAEDGRIRVKDQIRLRAPDGHVRDTYVAGIERWSGPNRRRDVHGILVPADISKVDVPPNTEIWLLKAEENKRV